MKKMRIISGKYKGRNLVGFTIHGTRPTQDRVKESIFSMIQGRLQEAIVLDLFAGSGNLGIEALSNGAKEAYLIDHSKEACGVIQKNLQTLGISNAKVLQMDYRKAFIYFQEKKIQFDLVFLDPPYKMLVLEDILKQMTEFQLLKEEAWIICEYETDHINDSELKMELLKSKKYGNKFVKIYLNYRE